MYVFCIYVCILYSGSILSFNFCILSAKYPLKQSAISCSFSTFLPLMSNFHFDCFFGFETSLAIFHNPLHSCLASATLLLLNSRFFIFYFFLMLLPAMVDLYFIWLITRIHILIVAVVSL